MKQASGGLREAALRFCFASMMARCRRKLLVKSSERSTKLCHSKTMMRPGSMPCSVSACCRAPVERDEWSTKLSHSNDDETGVDAVQRLNTSCICIHDTFKKKERPGFSQLNEPCCATQRQPRGRGEIDSFFGAPGRNRLFTRHGERPPYQNRRIHIFLILILEQ